MSATFFEELKKQFVEGAPEGLLDKTHEQAWKQFCKMGLPQKRGGFQYVPLQKLYGRSFVLSNESLAKQDVATFFVPECPHRLLFINGHYAPSLSTPPPKMVLLPLEEALKTYGGFLQPRLEKQEADPFALLNLAFSRAVFAYLPPKVQLEQPVQCLHLLTQKEAFAAPRVHLFLGKESSMKLVQTTEAIAGSWQSSVIDCALEEGARFEQISWSDDSPCPIFDAVRATLKRDAHFAHLSITRGGVSHRQSFSIALGGERASAALDGVSLLKQEHTAHVHVLMEHLAPHTLSKQLFKAAVRDASQSSFEGKIHVASPAQKTEAYQLSSNLILNEGAQAFCKPNLQIFADDVKASHGATVGQFSQEELFYLKTRGLSDDEGRRLLLAAFCQEVGNKLSIPSLKKRFAETLSLFTQGSA